MTLTSINVPKYTISEKEVSYFLNNKIVYTTIPSIEINDQTLLNKIINKFNKDTRVLQWVGHNTYYVDSYKTLKMKSNSLDELFEMFKAKELGLEVPERKCRLA